MFSIPYSFGALAKVNSDWMLHAQPPHEWFRRREGFPYTVPLFPWFIAWGGFVFDLIIVPLLVHPWTKYRVGFPGAVTFNAMNKFMFNIGVFPISMTNSLLLFVEVQHGRGVHNRLGAASNVLFGTRFHTGEDLKLDQSARSAEEPAADAAMMMMTTPEAKRVTEIGGRCDSTGTGGGAGGGRYSAPQKLVLAFVACFFCVHLVVPLRHFFLYEGNPSWSEEGHLAAWHMMLRTKRGGMFLVATDTKGQRMMLRPIHDRTVTNKHLKKVVTRPHTTLMYARYVAKVFQAAGRPLASIQVVSCYKLNGRKSQRLFDHRAGTGDRGLGTGD